MTRSSADPCDICGCTDEISTCLDCRRNDMILANRYSCILRGMDAALAEGHGVEVIMEMLVSAPGIGKFMKHSLKTLDKT